MELVFEHILTFDDGWPLNFTHEPDNIFTKYYKTGKLVKNMSVDKYKGDLWQNWENLEIDYSNLEFKNEDARLTTEAISTFGVKGFPQLGSYGWYKTLYSQQTKVLVPINRLKSEYAHPSFTITINSNDLIIDITDPEVIKYDCYRVIFRTGYFADEYISYEKTFDIPKPPQGTYYVSIIGYRDDGIISIESNVYELTIP